MLLTDTAFCRNRRNHAAPDTLNRLNVRRLRLAVDALLASV